MSQSDSLVRVRLFARVKDLAGMDAIELPLPRGATVGELRRRLAEAKPALRDLLERCAIAVDEEFANDNLELRPGLTVAVIPPVSGG